MIKVSLKVYEGLEKIRQSGKTNMFDYNAVMFYANENEDYETVVWLNENKELYIKGIFEGFEPDS